MSDRNLILVKGEDKTFSVRSWRFEKYKPVVFITYENGKEYPYNTSDVKFFKDPEIVLLKDRIALKEGIPLTGAVELQYFDRYCRIVYKTGRRELTTKRNIRIVNSALVNSDSKKCFGYLKNLAEINGLIVEGRNILTEHYDKIDFIREDSVLADYLRGEFKNEITAKGNVIYPFGFNLSQKKAVENALCNKLSFIEGPPGTGKTQTILNIIANAVTRGESVAVVSNNNSATANVLEKLKKRGFDFLAAPLGSVANKDDFIEFKQTVLPDMSQWGSDTISDTEIKNEEKELDEKLALRNELSAATAELDALKKEYEHFCDNYNKTAEFENLPDFSKKIKASKILDFIAEYEILYDKAKKPGILKMLRLKFTYGLKNLNFFGQSAGQVLPYCQNEYYKRRILELEEKNTSLQAELNDFRFKERIELYTDLSTKVFKKYLFKKYGTNIERKKYTKSDLRRNAQEFIEDYPVVLSSTYSLSSCLSSSFMYDYVVVDEASQANIVTGALALSCAKKAVIVGDLKQLPNVVDNAHKTASDRIFAKYGLSEKYRFSTQSLLSSLIALFPEAPRVLLREHYRCHPEIIGFCNQRFYNNELIVMSEYDSVGEPLKVYRTVPGNHARAHVNKRQIEEIEKLFEKEGLGSQSNNVGIITPYRDQAEAIRKAFKDTHIDADTVDKFQGQERDVIIFSTVDNQIGDFVSDPNRLNVAVSRAVKRLIVVTDGNDNDDKSPIHELIGYIRYRNHEIIDGEISSVFDCLYSCYADAREKILKKYGRVSDTDSENLMYALIRDILADDEFSKYAVLLHVPLSAVIKDRKKLNSREKAFVENHLTHVDFLIYSRLTHKPVYVVEVDGFAYHNNEKQKERDGVKDSVLKKYDIPVLRLSTVGSMEKQKLVTALRSLD